MSETTIYHVKPEGAYSATVFTTTDGAEAERVRALYNGRIDRYVYNDDPYVPLYKVRKSGETGDWVVSVIPTNEKDREENEPGEHNTKWGVHYVIEGGTPAEARAHAVERDSYPYYGVRIQLVSMDEAGNVGEVLDSWHTGTINFKWKTREVGDRKLRKLNRIVQRSFARPSPDYVKPERPNIEKGVMST